MTVGGLVAYIPGMPAMLPAERFAFGLGLWNPPWYESRLPELGKYGILVVILPYVVVGGAI